MKRGRQLGVCMLLSMYLSYQAIHHLAEAARRPFSAHAAHAAVATAATAAVVSAASTASGAGLIIFGTPNMAQNATVCGLVYHAAAHQLRGDFHLGIAFTRSPKHHASGSTHPTIPPAGPRAAQ